jgi:nucleoside-triphosphatase THEP1
LREFLEVSREVEAVERLLQSTERTKCMLFAIHRRADHPLLRQIHEEFRVYKVTAMNRERLAEEIAAAFIVGKGRNG